MRLPKSRILLVATLAAGWLWLSSAVATAAQEPPTIQKPRQQAEVSEKELTAFAKCYVEFHKIRAEYEPALQSARDPQEKGRIEREAVAKFGKAVEKQGLTLQSYAQIFKSVSADEQLREKAMKLIEEEREKT